MFITTVISLVSASIAGLFACHVHDSIARRRAKKVNAQMDSKDKQISYLKQKAKNLKAQVIEMEEKAVRYWSQYELTATKLDKACERIAELEKRLYEANSKLADPEQFEPTNESETIENMTIRELKKLASNRKIKGYSRMVKADLIAALTTNS